MKEDVFEDSVGRDRRDQKTLVENAQADQKGAG
jgi:hypothetical protein